MGRPCTLLLVGALLAMPVTGCMGPSNTPSFAVARPAIGGTYVYEGSDGSRLEVRIDGTGRRVDGHLTDHDVLLIDWSWTRPAGRFTYEMTEAVDRSSGQIVQQVADCVPYDEVVVTDDPPRACFDERAIVVLAGAAGLPGAFGAAPLWGETVTTEEVAVPAPVQGATRGPDPIPYRVETASERSGCLRFEATADMTRLRPLNHTVVGGPFTLCPDVPLPVAFTALSETRYRLVDRQPGSQTASISGPAWSTDKPGIGLRTWSSPVVVDPNDGDPYRFSFEEAHEWAKENVTRYREILSGEPGGLVPYTWPTDGAEGGTTGGVVTLRNESLRGIAAVAPDGTGVKLDLRKSRTWMGDESIEIVERENLSWDSVPNRSSVASRLVSVDASVSLARKVTGNGLSRTGVIQQPTFRDHVWAPTHEGDSELRIRRDGYTVVAWIEEDPPYPIGPNVKAPYEFVVDGPSGAVEFLALNRTRLPVRQHV